MTGATLTVDASPAAVCGVLADLDAAAAAIDPLGAASLREAGERKAQRDALVLRRDVLATTFRSFQDAQRRHADAARRAAQAKRLMREADAALAAAVEAGHVPPASTRAHSLFASQLEITHGEARVRLEHAKALGAERTTDLEAAQRAFTTAIDAVSTITAATTIPAVTTTTT